MHHCYYHCRVVGIHPSATFLYCRMFTIYLATYHLLDCTYMHTHRHVEGDVTASAPKQPAPGGGGATSSGTQKDKMST